MRQLTLDIRPDATPRFDNFVPGANTELLTRLQVLALCQAPDAIYLCGPAGSGRTHLLCATCAAAAVLGRQALMVQGAHAGDDLPLPQDGLLVVDDVEQLSAPAQIALFRAFNAAGSRRTALLMSGNAPPLRLALREDLRTRIGSALVFEVRPLNDEDKAETLARHARARGMNLPREVVDYLLHHGRRDLPWLLAALDALDAGSLERKRPPTLHLLREVLQARVDLSPVSVSSGAHRPR